MKLFLNILAAITIIPALFLGIFLFYLNFSDFAPDPMKELNTIHRKPQSLDKKEISLISWNIGYAGLGKEMDFFYEGGNMVRASKQLSEHYLYEITQFIAKEETDFWLLQEVDFKAKRSYNVNQSLTISRELPQFNYVSAVNYDVFFVPVPWREPMGYVNAGMMTFSKFSPRLSRRYAYPQIAGWPDRMFLPDRCFIETRFTVGQGKELVVINTHNSAYINKPLLMKKELEILYSKMLREFDAGNYVIAGGDWNMNPPQFFPDETYNGHRFTPSDVSFPVDFLPAGWKFSFDPTKPSNRQLNKAYDKGSNGTTTLDFFILSPNVRLKSVQAIDLEFEYSDHNPVKIEVILL